MKAYKIGQRTARMLQWLNRGADLDSTRDQLRSVRREGDAIVAADGFALFAADKPDDWPEGVKGLEIGWIGKPKAHALSLNQPNHVILGKAVEPGPLEFERVAPHTKPLAIVAVDPKRLIAILKDIESSAVILRLYGEDKPIEILAGVDAPYRRYAVLMPMHMDSHRDTKTWMPEILRAKAKTPPPETEGSSGGDTRIITPPQQPEG